MAIIKTNINSLGTTIKINLNYEQISILIKIGLSSLGFLVYRLKTEDEIIFKKKNQVSRPFFLFLLPQQWEDWGCTKNWEGTQPDQVTPTDQGGIPDHMASIQCIQLGEERGRRDVWVDSICLPG